MAEPKPRDLAALLLTLTVVTGVVDAVSFLGLGRVFVANMTGNVVFLGFAAAGESTLSVLASLTAVLAFLAGALAGGRLARRDDDYDALRQATAVQAALVAVAVVLSATLGSGTRVGSELLIVVLGVAMGLQNAAVRRIGAPDLTTTVLTMTLTGFAADSKAAGGPGSHPLRKVAAVGAMLVGAFAGGLLQLHVAMWTALTLALVLVLGVLAVLQVGRGRNKPATGSDSA
ncbi:YoaK family protein [Amycolatopsis sp. NPDC005961]|uniref:YoaK family protein n=1 Tax=Amycolatopsis sp. NPDC005961 TaxID=3156720 RepID=UPI003411B8A9